MSPERDPSMPSAAESFSYRRHWESQHQSHPGSIQAVGVTGRPDWYNWLFYTVKERALDRLTRGWSPERVLDAGSGIGIFTEYWARRSPRVLCACDLSEQAARSTRGRCADARVTQALLSGLPYADESFDLVHCFDVLYHITDDADWERAVRELLRVTASAGRIVFIERWANGPEWSIPEVRYRGRHRYESILASRGWITEKIEPLYLLLVPNSGLVRAFPRLCLWAERLLRLPLVRQLAHAHMVTLRRHAPEPQGGNRSAGESNR